MPKTILKVFFSGVVFLLCLEGALRVYNPFPFTVNRGRIVLPSNKTYEFHNDRIANLDPVIRTRRNSLGFRGAEPPKNLNDVVSLITVGGSTTACDYLSEGQTWPDRLSQLLNKKVGPVWVNNAGLDGHSTFGHLLLLNDFLVKLRPKYILFLVGLNDVERKSANTHDKKIEKGRYEFGSIRTFLQSSARNLESVSLASNLYRLFLARKRGLSHSTLDLASQETLTMSDDAIKAMLASNRAESIPAYEDRISRLIEICRSSGITPIFATQPALYGIGKDPVTGVDLEKIGVLKGRNGRGMWLQLEQYNDALRAICEREKVLCVELAHNMPKSSKYYYDFYHFTKEGARKVAEIMARSLVGELSRHGSEPVPLQSDAS